MLQEPEKFSTAVQGLLRSQKTAIEANSDAGGQNLCFMGSGRLDEDQYMHMVVASFLKKNTQYVSVLTSGYASIHDYYGQSANECLKDHDSHRCIMCIGPSSSTVNQIMNSTSNNSSSTSTTQRIGNLASTKNHNSQSSFDLFSKLSNAMKTKSQEVKGKLKDSMVNIYGLQAGSSASNVPIEKHVSKNERNGKRYRDVAPVFSIDEDSADGVVDIDEANANYTDDEPERIVDMQSFIKSPDVIKVLKCQEVHMNGYMYDRHLILTKTHLVVLGDVDRNGGAEVIVRRPLSNIVKITARKRHRDLITFKYGVPNGDELIITDMDRFLIPNASEATALVSKQIIKQLEEPKNDETSSNM